MSSGFMYFFDLWSDYMQLPCILPSCQNPTILFPDFRLMQPQPSSLPWQNCPSQVQIYPQSMCMIPLPWMKPWYQNPRQMTSSKTKRVPRPCRLPWWKWPQKWIFYWYWQDPLPCFNPLTIYPLNLIYSSWSWQIADIIQSVGRIWTDYQAWYYCSVVRGDSRGGMEFILETSSLFSNLSSTIVSSRTDIFSRSLFQFCLLQAGEVLELRLVAPPVFSTIVSVWTLCSLIYLHLNYLSSI